MGPCENGREWTRKKQKDRYDKNNKTIKKERDKSQNGTKQEGARQTDKERDRTRENGTDQQRSRQHEK